MSEGLKIDVDVVSTDEKLISILEQIIKHIKEGNVYTPEDKEMMIHKIEEYTTGISKELDHKTIQYLFTGWFVHNFCMQNQCQ